MPEPNEDLEQNCTIRIHLIIDSARQKLKNKKAGWCSDSSLRHLQPWYALELLLLSWGNSASGRRTQNFVPAMGARPSPMTDTHPSFSTFSLTQKEVSVDIGLVPSSSTPFPPLGKKRNQTIQGKIDSTLFSCSPGWPFCICPKCLKFPYSFNEWRHWLLVLTLKGSVSKGCVWFEPFIYTEVVCSSGYGWCAQGGVMLVSG